MSAPEHQGTRSAGPKELVSWGPPYPPIGWSAQQWSRPMGAFKKVVLGSRGRSGQNLTGAWQTWQRQACETVHDEHRRGLAHGGWRHEILLIREWSDDDSASALQGHAQNISVLWEHVVCSLLVARNSYGGDFFVKVTVSLQNELTSRNRAMPTLRKIAIYCHHSSFPAEALLQFCNCNCNFIVYGYQTSGSGCAA